MRQVSIEIVKERKANVLRAVIHHYIKTGKPVGSNVLIDEYKIKLSPATVRNLMAELEEEEFLTHPHTSAGRIPTDKGYRAYVDSILKLQQFAIAEEGRIKKEYEQKHNEIEAMLSETSRILSGLSQYTGFVLAPKTEYNEITNIELVQIAPAQLLIILLTHTGMVKHRKIDASLTPEQLAKLRIFLNERVRGVSLSEATSKIVSEMRKIKKDEEDIYKTAKKISDAFYAIHDDIYIDGTSNTMEIPEFSDFGQVRSLVKLNEDKEKLIQIVNEDFSESGVHVKIGSENSLAELKDLSVVTTVYKDGEKAVGVLGIIGPKRMEYERMMGLVNTVSQMLNEFFKKK
ncbi:heat-inducible transcriptional repressor HrcA [Endomicrobium proavitum]|uniref:Heat-inducible transcription repressor HrcA n=1 Tax=Endomicrobium proavitum TaxID=1408281 RepID=A0A0G3WIM6_9BACT|nr:heat-inducible transcriptional repressor HrcA [Endomicrobium proavitum]AKL98163.1 Heat-inducible transcription repressor hrcA [Endomicrobium proavitum]